MEEGEEGAEELCGEGVRWRRFLVVGFVVVLSFVVEGRLRFLFVVFEVEGAFLVVVVVVVDLVFDLLGRGGEKSGRGRLGGIVLVLLKIVVGRRMEGSLRERSVLRKVVGLDVLIALQLNDAGSQSERRVESRWRRGLAREEVLQWNR